MAVIAPTDLAGSSASTAEAFPLLYVPTQPMGTEASSVWVSAHRTILQTALAQSGALVFRGFGLASDADFDRFIQAFDWPNFTYAESLSNAVRRNRTERVFTASEAPPEASIYLHHEMAQTPISPSKLFFFCQYAADEGGATPLCRSDKLFEALKAENPELARDFKEKGLKYTTTMPAELVDDVRDLAVLPS